jgi:hypothetical protein
MSWIKPNTITGSAAEGINYFRRIDFEHKIWSEIAKNNHILFLAPRRVGKSSIVIYMAGNPKQGFSCKYENIQTDNSLQDFYFRLCRMTYESITKTGIAKKWIKDWWDGWKITSITIDGIDIKNTEIDYQKVFKNLLENLKNNNEKVVLFIDEFPDVVWNIYQKSGQNDAETLLNGVRELRHTKNFKDVFVFVLLGSVGLSHIVKKISGRIDKINDLHIENLTALNANQINEFLNHILEGATMQISPETRTYLLNKIGYFIPFYIQLLIEECDTILYNDQRFELQPNDIDLAYKQLLKKHKNFEDWDGRLSKYFHDKYPYFLEILSTCAKNHKITLQEIYNIAVKYDNTMEWKADLDDVLIADGYLFENDEIYAFNSPLLRDWWKARHPLMKKS